MSLFETKIETSDFPQPQLPTLHFPQPSVSPPPIISPAKIPSFSDQPHISSSNSNVQASPSSSHNPKLEHKNLLQEFAQKSNLPLPVYETVNEGLPHAPKFRSTVFVNGVKVTSQMSFGTRKSAEKFVAGLALQHVNKQVAEEDNRLDIPLLQEETVFCKSVVHELASKMNMHIPTYTTATNASQPPQYTSTLVFNGLSFNGGPTKSKKEAEQLAARAVLTFHIDAPTIGKVIREMIKSKRKLLGTLRNFDNPTPAAPLPVNAAQSSEYVHNTNIRTESGIPLNNVPLPVTAARNSAYAHGTNIATESGIPLNNVPAPVTVDNLPKAENIISNTADPVGKFPPIHEIKFSKPDSIDKSTNLQEPTPSQATQLPIEFVHPSSAPSVNANPISSKKRRKNKKKANKRPCMGAGLPGNNLSYNQAPSGSVALSM